MSIVTPPSRRRASDYEAAPYHDDSRELAIAGLKRKRKVAEDAGAYVAVNCLLWLIWLIADRSTDGSIPWPAWVSLGWGILLAADAWRAFGSRPRSLHRPITDAEIEREITRTRR